MFHVLNLFICFLKEATQSLFIVEKLNFEKILFFFFFFFFSKCFIYMLRLKLHFKKAIEKAYQFFSW